MIEKKFYDNIEFNLDNEIRTMPRATQGDTQSRGMYVSLVIDNVVQTSLTGYTMKFFAYKPDKTRVFTDAVIDGSIFRIDHKNQTFASPGTVLCALVLYDTSGAKIADKKFKMLVDSSLEEDAIISEDERGIIDSALELAENLPTLQAIQAAEMTRSAFYGGFNNKLDRIKSDFNYSITTGKNKFNKDKATTGYYVNNLTGGLSANPDKAASDYIRVEHGVDYYITGETNLRWAFYDKDLMFLTGGTNYLFENPLVVPINASFVRFSFDTINKNEIQFEENNITEYENFGFKFSKPAELEKESIKPEYTTFFEQSKNLFNKQTALKGVYISYTTGTLMNNESYYASDFISVEPNTDYTSNFDGQLAFYNNKRAFISGVYGTGSKDTKTFKTPENAFFVRVSTKLPEITQVEKGQVSTEYKNYGYFLKYDYLDKTVFGTDAKTDEFLMFLPEEIYVAQGRTIEIYYDQITWTGNINNYHFKTTCQIASPMRRKVSITSDNIGNYPLTIQVFDNNMRVVTTKTSTVKVVSNILNSQKTVLTIGDSLTNTTSTYKPTWKEIGVLSNGKIKFVGTRGLTDGEKHEGRSGWRANDYLTASSYGYENEGVHPFWDGARFNWNHYKTTTGIEPDMVQIWLGTNGISLDPTTNANNIKQIVDYIRQDDPTIPIYVAYTIYRGNQNGLGVQRNSDGYVLNHGAWELEEKRKVFNLMVKLNELLKSYSNLYFVPLATCHDTEYNFGSMEKPVNPRAEQTEFLPVEATHPQEQGYLQIADIMFSAFCSH